MTVIKCHMTASKYGNMGIKLTALIQLLQMNTKFSISNNWRIKKRKQSCSRFSPLYFHLWIGGSIGRPLKLIISKNHWYICDSLTKEHHMNHLPTTFLKIGGDLHTLTILTSAIRPYYQSYRINFDWCIDLIRWK